MPEKQRTNAHDPESARKEQGFILVFALMVLVVLSLMGGAAMMVRNTEQQLVGNSEIVENNFYAAETVTIEGATNIENMADSILLKVASFPTWLQPDEDKTIRELLADSSQWPNAKITPQGTSFTAGDRKITPIGYAPNGASTGDRLWYAAVQGNLRSDDNSYDICSGSDLSDETKVEKCYTVYGMYDVKSGKGKAYSGRKLLMVGYKKTLYYPE
jgi:hypothetical protein